MYITLQNMAAKDKYISVVTVTVTVTIIITTTITITIIITSSITITNTTALRTGKNSKRNGKIRKTTRDRTKPWPGVSFRISRQKVSESDFRRRLRNRVIQHR